MGRFCVVSLVIAVGLAGCGNQPEVGIQVDSFLKNKHCDRDGYVTWRRELLDFKARTSEQLNQPMSQWQHADARRFEEGTSRLARLEFCEIGLPEVMRKCDEAAGVMVGDSRATGVAKENIPLGAVGYCGAASELVGTPSDPIIDAQYARARAAYYVRYNLAFDTDLAETIYDGVISGHPSSYTTACEYYLTVLANNWTLPLQYRVAEQGEATRICTEAWNKAGSGPAAYALGLFAESGVEFKPDLGNAINWYQQASAKGMDVTDDIARAEAERRRQLEAQLQAEAAAASQMYSTTGADPGTASTDSDQVAGAVALGALVGGVVCLFFEDCRAFAADVGTYALKQGATAVAQDFVTDILTQQEDERPQ